MIRNIVLLCLDTVRKDYFDAYAKRLTDRADVVFEQCRAASCWSVPSHASMMTGRLPHGHGVDARYPLFESLDAAETLRSDLPAHEFVGVSANVYAGSAYGFDSLFDEFTDVARTHRYVDGLDIPAYLSDTTEPGLPEKGDVVREILTHPFPTQSLRNAAILQLEQWTTSGPLSAVPTPLDDGGASVCRIALDRLREREAESPVFLFANLMEAHEPHRDTWQYDSELYSVPRGWDSTALNTWDAVDPTDETETALDRYRDLYGAAIDYLDRIVSDLVERLREVTTRETTVILTADHGENLALPADDGHLGHVTSLTEAVLHVPLLIINPPAGFDPNEGEYVSHLGLRELIRGIAHDETPSITRDRVPAEVIDITPGNDRLRETDPEYWTRTLRCMYDEQEKYEWDSRGIVSRIELDPTRPSWQRRRWQRETDHSQYIGGTSDEFSVPIDEITDQPDHVASGEPLSDDVRRRLSDLGYR